MRVFGGWARRGMISLTVLLVAPVLAAQSSSEAPQYQVSTHLVQLSVITRNKDGRATELTKDDFVVLDRGKAQTISVFQAEPARPVAGSAAALPPNTFSNESRIYR